MGRTKCPLGAVGSSRTDRGMWHNIGPWYSTATWGLKCQRGVRKRRALWNGLGLQLASEYVQDRNQPGLSWEDLQARQEDHLALRERPLASCHPLPSFRK